MGTISFTPITDGSTATASQVNSPLSTIYNDYNGNITDANIASGAAIAGSKLAIQSVKNPYKFRVYRTSAYSTTINTATATPFDTKTYDTGTNVDVSTNKGRFTAPIAGFYHFNANLSQNSTTRLFISFYVNGSEISRGNDIAYASNRIGAHHSDEIQLNASDYVEVYYFSTVGTAIDLGSNFAYFSGFLVSAT